MVQVEEPVPDTEKSFVASPVTASLNTMSYVLFEEFVIAVLGVNVVRAGPRDVIVTKPTAALTPIQLNPIDEKDPPAPPGPPQPPL